MNIIIKKDCTNINWQEVRNILKAAGMSLLIEEFHKKSFEK